VLYSLLCLTSRSLTTASNSVDSSASCVQIIFLWPPMQNSTQMPFVHSLPCRAQLHCQPSTITSELDWSHLQHFGTNHIENTVSNSTSIVAYVSVTAGTSLLSSCLAIVRVLPTCLPAVTKQRLLFTESLLRNGSISYNIKEFCNHEIRHCYYKFSGYHSNEIWSVNTYECKLCSRSQPRD
jgi:hypothetical protein